jgi:hypothetical protein
MHPSVHHARAAAVALTAATALLLGGCGIKDPYANQPTSPLTAAEEGNDHNELTTEDQTTGVTTGDTAADTRGAERVARLFAATSLTYSPDTYARQQRTLREHATGEMSHQLAPPVPDEDTAATLQASQLTSRAQILVSDIESSTSSTASVIVLLKVFTGSGGRRSATPDYQPYRVRLQRTNGRWKVTAMDAP